MLAASFGIYSLVKKRTHLAPTEGMLLETALIAVPALAVLAWLGTQGELALGHGARGTDLLLISTGLMTTVPLVALPMRRSGWIWPRWACCSTWSPTLQLCWAACAARADGCARRLAGFVWAGLAVFSAGASGRAAGRGTRGAIGLSAARVGQVRQLTPRVPRRHAARLRWPIDSPT